VSYFFWAMALLQTAILKMAAADRAASRGRVMGMLLSLLLFLSRCIPDARFNPKSVRVLALDQ
jgi:hypothetical protein